MSFDNPFLGACRSLILLGEALDRIPKNKTRPYRVRLKINLALYKVYIHGQYTKNHKQLGITYLLFNKCNIFTMHFDILIQLCFYSAIICYRFVKCADLFHSSRFIINQNFRTKSIRTHHHHPHFTKDNCLNYHLIP
jgi:hypothetical protein